VEVIVPVVDGVKVETVVPVLKGIVVVIAVMGEVPIVLVPEEDVGDVVVRDIVDEDVVFDG
jgi:hypothetical protein